MGPASDVRSASSARNPAAVKTATSYESSSAPGRTRVPPVGYSCRLPERLASPVHTRPLCTPPGVPQTQLPCNVLELNGGGLLLDRHEPPLTRRFVVYYCSAVYIWGGKRSDEEGSALLIL